MTSTEEDRRKAYVTVEEQISAIPATDWNDCANSPDRPDNPFVSHEFLKALEDSNTVCAQTGWHPQHLVLHNDLGIRAIMPCYLKSHSSGEYVFDHAWADAYERAGGNYYPKLQSSIPFTPVTGPRLLTRSHDDSEDAQTTLALAACELVNRLALSSLHITFTNRKECQLLQKLGYLKRTDQQFHWRNENYENFEQFLQSLSSRKRKAIRKERREATQNGIGIKWITGSAITEDHWDAFFEFYMDTADRKWGMPYLNREFFSRLSQTMNDRILLILCKRAGKWIAGALNILGGDTIFGRYWGAIEHHNCLHFETCYYQAIEYAIQNNLRFVEAGAQGPHKIARGYLPRTTYSAHYIADPKLRNAISDFLRREADYDKLQIEELNRLSPYKANHHNGRASSE